MTQQQSSVPGIEAMPRGGPGASRLDRFLQTDRLEFTDRYDVSDAVKQRVVDALDRIGHRFGVFESNARLALELVAEVENPRILELGAGHGQLSARILELDPRVRVTATDLDPASVAVMAAGPLGSNPRATVRVTDGTAIQDADGSYDLVVWAAGFHHLPPGVAARAIADATRVGRRFLVVDGIRPSGPALLVRILLFPLMMLLIGALARLPLATIPPTLHDGLITRLRLYSVSAFEALAAAAGSNVSVEFRIEGSPERDHPVIFGRS